jgi:hypothetical protein
MAESRHFSIVVIDIERSGDLTDPEKRQVRDDLYAIVDSALLESEISATTAVIPEDRGDGIYLLVAADVPIRRLIDPFIGVIDAALAARHVGDPKMRLRLVVHHGEVAVDANGSSGVAADRAFAMVDSSQLRDALTDAKLGRIAVVVPDDVYQSVVRGYPAPDPTTFRMRLLKTKRESVKAWITVTGSPEQPPGRTNPSEPGLEGPTSTSAPFNPQQNVIGKAADSAVVHTVHGGLKLDNKRKRTGER